MRMTTHERGRDYHARYACRLGHRDVDDVMTEDSFFGWAVAALTIMMLYAVLRYPR